MNTYAETKSIALNIYVAIKEGNTNPEMIEQYVDLCDLAAQKFKASYNGSQYNEFKNMAARMAKRFFNVAFVADGSNINTARVMVSVNGSLQTVICKLKENDIELIYNDSIKMQYPLYRVVCPNLPESMLKYA